MRRNEIIFAPRPDPATLHETPDMRIILWEDGELTADLTKNTTDMLEFLKDNAGIEKEALLDFCG